MPFPSASENCVSKYALSFIIEINMGKFYRHTNGFCPALAHSFNQMLLGLTHYSLGQIILGHIIPWVQTGSVFLKPSQWPLAMLILDLSVLAEEQFSTSVCFCWDIHNYPIKPLCSNHVISLFCPANDSNSTKKNDISPSKGTEGVQHH